MFDQIIHVLSLIVLTIALGFGCFLAASGLIEKLDDFVNNTLMWRIRDQMKREIGKIIASEAYWFSESKEAAEAVKLIGEAYLNDGGSNIHHLRDEWRRRVKGSD